MENSEIQGLSKDIMKEKLIGYIDELSSGDFFEKVNSDDLGSSNIRNMGNVALNCDCYKEFRLYMEYKKSKIKGWGFKKGENALADIVISHLDEIYKTCGQNDRETLEWISLYFGYFYWKKASIEGQKQSRR